MPLDVSDEQIMWEAIEPFAPRRRADPHRHSRMEQRRWHHSADAARERWTDLSARQRATRRAGERREDTSPGPSPGDRALEAPRLRRHGWMRDLTREGVEANPGPVLVRDRTAAHRLLPLVMAYIGERPSRIMLVSTSGGDGVMMVSNATGPLLFTGPVATLSVLAGWIRDLTTEGIEPNPGPPKATSDGEHVVHACPDATCAKPRHHRRQRGKPSGQTADNPQAAAAARGYANRKSLVLCTNDLGEPSPLPCPRCKGEHYHLGRKTEAGDNPKALVGMTASAAAAIAEDCGDHPGAAGDQVARAQGKNSTPLGTDGKRTIMSYATEYLDAHDLPDGTMQVRGGSSKPPAGTCVGWMLLGVCVAESCPHRHGAVYGRFVDGSPLRESTQGDGDQQLSEAEDGHEHRPLVESPKGVSAPRIVKPIPPPEKKGRPRPIEESKSEEREHRPPAESPIGVSAPAVGSAVARPHTTAVAEPAAAREHQTHDGASQHRARPALMREVRRGVQLRATPDTRRWRQPRTAAELALLRDIRRREYTLKALARAEWWKDQPVNGHGTTCCVCHGPRETDHDSVMGAVALIFPYTAEGGGTGGYCEACHNYACRSHLQDGLCRYCRARVLTEGPCAYPESRREEVFINARRSATIRPPATVDRPPGADDVPILCTDKGIRLDPTQWESLGQRLHRWMTRIAGDYHVTPAQIGEMQLLVPARNVAQSRHYLWWLWQPWNREPDAASMDLPAACGYEFYRMGRVNRQVIREVTATPLWLQLSAGMATVGVNSTLVSQISTLVRQPDAPYLEDTLQHLANLVAFRSVMRGSVVPSAARSVFRREPTASPVLSGSAYQKSVGVNAP